MASKKLKASERQAILQKLTTELRKKYGRKVPSHDFPVLESLLFAACLEDSSEESARSAYARLLESFFDLNEIRVSSIAEIEAALGDIENAEWKALRIRDTLQTVFEANYKYEFDQIRRKTQDAALRDLKSIRYATPFMKLFVLQNCCSCHVLPIDESILSLLKYLGLVGLDDSVNQAAEEIKSAVRKSDTTTLCHYLRCVATDSKYREDALLSEVERKQAINPHEALTRLQDLLKGTRRRRKAAEKKKVTKTRKKPTPKTSKKRPAKKTAASKKKVVKKKVVKKKVTKKKATKKKTTKKAATKKKKKR